MWWAGRGRAGEGRVRVAEKLTKFRIRKPLAYIKQENVLSFDIK